ncbi:MAG: hypothetical protein J0L80_02460 [Chitinophagales bacterium]|nr:hypothetical protein [Chitinophagales bacterium]
MARLDEFKSHLKAGKVYRRSELARWSNAVDRQLSLLVKDGTLEKLSQGMYYVPKKTVFGVAPPDEETLVRTFLKDDDFLLTSPNAYNSLGVGTTQLYNKRVVYNHKRHGEFVLGGKKFFFHAKHRFPKEATPEFLLVDLVNNLGSLAEDREYVLSNVVAKARTMPLPKLKRAVLNYGNTKAKALLTPLFTENNEHAH